MEPITLGAAKAYAKKLALGGAIPIPGPPGPQGPPGQDAIANINAMGTWDANTTYMLNDFVMCSDGNAYISIMDNNLGVYPPNYTNAWTKFVAAGAQGPQGEKGDPANLTTELFEQTFSNATFDGQVNAISVDLSADVTMVSFWGYANQNATGTSGQSFQILDPATYPLLERFVGQVDQMSYGYNANIGTFSYSPIRITATQGMEIVTAPNIAVGTRFSFQFVLVLAVENA